MTEEEAELLRALALAWEEVADYALSHLCKEFPDGSRRRAYRDRYAAARELGEGGV